MYHSNDVHDRNNMDEFLDCYVHIRIAEPGVHLPPDASRIIHQALEELDIPMFNPFFLDNEIHFASTIGYFDRNDIMNEVIRYLNNHHISNARPVVDITAY